MLETSGEHVLETRFHNLQHQALTQFIKLYQYMTLDHFLSEKVMVFDNFLAADKHK